jgi:DNA-binding Xre family transcriptional regulator
MINQINRYTWTKEMADRLRSARGKTPKTKLVASLRCGKDQIRKLEETQHKTISVMLLNAICAELNTTVDYMIYGENNDQESTATNKSISNIETKQNTRKGS